MHGPRGSVIPASAYEGVDALESFSSLAALEARRQGLLEQSVQEVAFIRRHVGERDLRVLEVGAGSGRLLVALAVSGVLRSGVGVELSQSRVAFGQRWAADLGLDALQFQCADALDPSAWTGEDFDLVIGVSHLIGYVEPVQKGALPGFVARLCRSLRSTGCVLIETYQLPPQREQMLRLSDNRLRVWMPLPAWDRFGYYLSDLRFDPEHRVIEHEKTFIARDGTVDTGRVERNAYHDVAALERYFRAAGCGTIRTFGDFTGGRFDEQSSARLIMLAGGPGWLPPHAPEADDGDAREVLVRPDGQGAWI